MSDINSADWKDLVNAVKENTGTMSKLMGGKSGSGNSDASTKDNGKSKSLGDYINLRSFNGVLSKTSDHLHALGGGSDDFLRTIKNLVGGFVIGGAAISNLIDAATSSVRVYRELADVGQTFGGSMIEMSKQAAQAGLPLEDFANLIKRSSTAAAILADNQTAGGKTLGNLTLAVRDNMRQFGFFGMTISDISDLTGDYAETLRLQGSTAELKNGEKTSKAISRFAQDISEFSTIAGKSRKQIMDATNSALRDVGVTSKFAAGSINAQTTAQREALQRSVAFGAAMPGDSGAQLSKFIGQSFGAGSSQYVSEIRDMSSKANVGEFMNILDRNNARVNAGNVTDESLGEMITSIQELYKSNAGQLNYQATVGNNDSAKQFIAFASGFEGINVKDAIVKMKSQVELAKSNAAFTNTMLVLEDTFHKFSSFFREGFLAGIEPLEQSFKDLNKDDSIGFFKTSLIDLGKSVGKLISTVFSPQNITKMISIFKQFTEMALPALKGVFDIISALVGGPASDEAKKSINDVKTNFNSLSVVIKSVGGVFGVLLTVVDGVSKSAKYIFDSFEKRLEGLGLPTGTSSTLAMAGTALVGVGGLRMLKGLASRMFNTASFGGAAATRGPGLLSKLGGIGTKGAIGLVFAELIAQLLPESSFKSVVENVLEVGGVLLTFGGIFKALVVSVFDIAKSSFSWAKDMFSKSVDAAGKVGEVATKIGEGASKLGEGVSEAISKTVESGGSFKSMLAETGTSILEKGKSLAPRVGAIAAETGTSILEKGKSLAPRVGAIAAEAGPVLSSLGKGVVVGLAAAAIEYGAGKAAEVATNAVLGKDRADVLRARGDKVRELQDQRPGLQHLLMGDYFDKNNAIDSQLHDSFTKWQAEDDAASKDAPNTSSTPSTPPSPPLSSLPATPSNPSSPPLSSLSLEQLEDKYSVVDDQIGKYSMVAEILSRGLGSNPKLIDAIEKVRDATETQTLILAELMNRGTTQDTKNARATVSAVENMGQ